MKNEKTIVYRLTFPNGKVYIGIAVNFQARMRVHAHLASRGARRPLYHAINKYGWESVQKDMLIVVSSTQQAWDLERKLIAQYDSTNSIRGYNLALGGRTKIGCKNSVPAWNKSKCLSETHKAALRAAKSAGKIASNGKTFGQIRSENATRFGVSILDLHTQQSTTFPNVSKCAKVIGVNAQAIYNHIARNGCKLKNRYVARKSEKF